MAEKYKKLLLKAINAGEKRDYLLAVDILEKIVAETDTFPEAFLYLGRSFHALGEYYKAVQALQYYIFYRENSPKGYFFLGRTYLILGFYAKALKCFKKTLQLVPENAEVLSLTGLAYLRLKKVSIALHYLEKAVYAAPQNKFIYNAYLNILYLKGVRDLYAGRVDEAGEIFEFILKTDKNLPSVSIYLAQVRKEQNRFKEALQLYDYVIKNNPNDNVLKMHMIPLLLQEERIDEASQLMLDLSEKNIPIDNIQLKNLDIHRVMAIEAFKKNKYKDAVFFAKKALKNNYYDNEIHLLIGEAFRHLSNYQKAENHYRLVLSRDKRKVEAIYGIILVMWSQEQFAELFKVLRRANTNFPSDNVITYYYALTAAKLLLDPNDVLKLLGAEMANNQSDAYLLEAVGEQYLRLQMPAYSENYFQKAIINNKKLSNAYIGLIKTYHMLGDKNKTGKVFRDYLLIFPDDNKIRRYYINHLYRIGNYEKAIKEIEQYSSEYAGDENATKLLAKSYLNIKNYQKAMLIYKQMLRAYPNNSNYLLSLAYCTDKLSGAAKALELLEKSRSYIKNNVDIELTIGVLASKLNKNKTALDAFKNALELDEKEWRVYFNIARIYESQGLKDFALKFKKLGEKFKKNT
ncbi:MAG: tetratricopeptide repeat protein [Spirochaetes bacterium]|nr:tetratricopeptide repeat protein [Spirochaetota bacterium]